MITRSKLLHIVQETIIEFRNDDGRLLGAAMVYYVLLSFVPILLLLIAISGLFLRFSDTANVLKQQILGTVTLLAGSELRLMLEQALDDLQQNSLIATAISLLILLYGASIVFRHLNFSFRKIWKPTAEMTSLNQTVRQTVIETVLDRVTAFVMVILMSLLLMSTFVITAVLQGIKLVLGYIPLFGNIATWLLDPLVTLALATLTFALLFKYLPPVTMHWRDVWFGALLCAVGFSVAGLLLTLYIAFIGVRSAYGALGTLLILMLWVYVCSMILFFCAEFCKVFARH